MSELFQQSNNNQSNKLLSDDTEPKYVQHIYSSEHT